MQPSRVSASKTKLKTIPIYSMKEQSFPDNLKIKVSSLRCNPTQWEAGISDITISKHNRVQIGDCNNLS